MEVEEIEDSDANGSMNVCPPDPMGSRQQQKEKTSSRNSNFPSNNVENTIESRNVRHHILTFDFPPPAAELPIIAKILHILVANNGTLDRKENVICHLQSPSEVARGRSGFVVEHEGGPFNHTDKVFSEQRFRDLERRSQAQVAETSSKFIELSPPEPMNTLTLLRSASDQLQLDPKTTLELAKKLHKTGLISSPLTSSTTYPSGFPSKEMIKSIVLQMDEFCGEEARLNAQDILGNFVRSSTRATGNTFAIHPLVMGVNRANFKRILEEDQTERKLYELICRYFLATCMIPSKMVHMTIKFSIGPELFKSIWHTVIVDGYLMAAPWIKPKFNETEPPMEAKQKQFQFVKQTFIVNNVRRQPLDDPKGGLAESELISKIHLLGLADYEEIPKLLETLVNRKLANIIGPGRWIVPTTEGFHELEFSRQKQKKGNVNDRIETLVQIDVSDDSEGEEGEIIDEEHCERTDGNSTKNIGAHQPGQFPRSRHFSAIHQNTPKKCVRFELPARLQRAKSMPHGLEEESTGEKSYSRHGRAASPPLNMIRVQNRIQQERKVQEFDRPITRDLEANRIEQPNFPGKMAVVRTNSVADTSERSSEFGTKIFIGNVPSRLSRTDLLNVFCEFGTIKYAQLNRDRGIAQIDYSNRFEAAKAIRVMDGSTLEGFVLKVDFYKTRSWSTNYHSTALDDQRQHWTNGFHSRNSPQTPSPSKRRLSPQQMHPQYTNGTAAHHDQPFNNESFSPQQPLNPLAGGQSRKTFATPLYCQSAKKFRVWSEPTNHHHQFANPNNTAHQPTTPKSPYQRQQQQRSSPTTHTARTEPIGRMPWNNRNINNNTHHNQRNCSNQANNNNHNNFNHHMDSSTNKSPSPWSTPSRTGTGVVDGPRRSSRIAQKQPAFAGNSFFFSR